MLFSLLLSLAHADPRLIAHRGLGQTFDLEGVGSQTCTAARIHPPTHPHLENTIPGIAAAISAGAAMVEIDLQPTADGQLVVFHDATLDCRTEASGRTRDQPLSALQALDAGYGYTADGGQSWPLRGSGVGLIPSFAEVTAAFPETAFILDLKTGAPGDAALYVAGLAALSAEQRGRLWVYGARDPVEAIRRAYPEVRAFTRGEMTGCLRDYMKQGWRGAVPAGCHDTVVFVPVNRARLVWGYPDRLVRRMEAVGTEVVILGPWYRGEHHSRGVDTLEQAAGVPADFGGLIWTNRVDLLGSSADMPNITQ